jgi:hypothetical protein
VPKFVQEKYQVNVEPYDDEAGNHAWLTDTSARAKKETPGREGASGGDYDSRFMNNAMFTNTLPPGMDIEDQEFTDQRKFNHSIAGNDSSGHNAGDVTRDLTAKSARNGFDRKECCPTDDAYTREHNDAFYDEIRLNGDEVGFIERNNYQDRL